MFRKGRLHISRFDKVMMTGVALFFILLVMPELAYIRLTILIICTAAALVYFFNHQ